MPISSDHDLDYAKKTLEGKLVRSRTEGRTTIGTVERVCRWVEHYYPDRDSPSSDPVNRQLIMVIALAGGNDTTNWIEDGDDLIEIYGEGFYRSPGVS